MSFFIFAKVLKLSVKRVLSNGLDGIHPFDDCTGGCPDVLGHAERTTLDELHILVKRQDAKL